MTEHQSSSELRESVDRARADRKAPVPSSDTPSDERAVVCAICDDPVAWSCTGDLIHRDRVLRDHDPVLDEATVRWLHGDPDAPAAPSAPVDGPERCHVGIDDGRLVQRLRAETISRAEHLVGPWTVDLIALAADRIEALAGGGGWSPKFETFEQYHAWVAASPTPVDGDSGEAATWNDLLVCERCKGPLAQPGALIFSPPSKADLVRKIHLCHWCYPILLTWLDSHIAEVRDDSPPIAPPVGEERRPVDGGERSQSEQWFVVHHNQIRSLRFGTFPIERLARASIAACTCGPHTLRHTVTTTYTASTTEEFVAAATDRGEG